MDFSGGSPKADHLCVLVHGLWGNPDHMNSIAKALREHHSQDNLYIFLAKRNSGSFTYDGIELGGERVCAEIIEELQAVEKNGGRITKLSIVGYSMGGLIARYAVGLLYAKGVLDSVDCMNFVTFAAPHLGTRSPLKRWHSHIWNSLGARIVSMSGRQLFITDDFRDTGRPLLSIMTDAESIFMRGLRRFKRHTLYSNIVNDRTAVYYTTCIEKTDPYKDLDHLKVNFVKGYEGLLLDTSNPFTPRPKLAPPATTFPSSVTSAMGFLRNAPFVLTLSVLLPVGAVVFLVASAYHIVRSTRRIRLYPEQAGFNVEEYRFPLLIKELQGGVEHAYGVLNSSQGQEFLGDGDDDDDVAANAQERSTLARERRLSVPSEPTLALAPSQFEMIRSLGTIGWRKYPVWIQSHRHSHAAIIVRTDKSSFKEGWLVLKHFASEEFLL